eukprot:512064-Rhodomonas_salina.1
MICIEFRRRKFLRVGYQLPAATASGSPLQHPAEHRKKIAEKRQAYQGVLRHFHRQRPSTIVQVMQQTYVMSCHGVVMAQDSGWSDSLAAASCGIQVLGPHSG